MVQLSKKQATIVGVGVVFFLQLTSSTKPFPVTPKLVPPKPSIRNIYPYSVISGGVQSPAELRDALLHDPVAATHYAGFDLQETRPIRADRQRKVYVSYRIGERIYWTRKRVLVPKGETLLTDGTNIARTRCGNRISKTPHSPTSASEPSETTLNTDITQPANNLPVPVTTRPVATELHKTVATTTPPGDYQSQFGPSQQTILPSGGDSASAIGAAGSSRAPGDSGAAGGGRAVATGEIAGLSGIGFGAALASVPLQSNPEWDLINLLTVSSGPLITPNKEAPPMFPGTPPQIEPSPEVPYPGLRPAGSGFPIDFVPVGQQPAFVTIPSSRAGSPSAGFLKEDIPSPYIPGNSIARKKILRITTDQHGPKSAAQDVQAPEPNTLLLNLGAAVLLFLSLKLKRPYQS